MIYRMKVAVLLKSLKVGKHTIVSYGYVLGPYLPTLELNIRKWGMGMLFRNLRSLAHTFVAYIWTLLTMFEL